MEETANTTAPVTIATASETTAADGAVTTTETVETVGVAEGGEVPTQPPQGNMLTSILPFVLLFGVLYFMMIRPSQRKEKERQKMISELRAGKRVTFAGGLLGKITEAKESSFMIEISPGVTVEVARGAVAGVVEESPAPTK